MHTHTPILTYARIRPALKREISQNRLNRCVAQQPDRPVLHVATKPGSPIVIEADGSTNSPDVRTFELDGVFDETTDTLSVYSKCAQPLVDGVLSGNGLDAFMNAYLRFAETQRREAEEAARRET